MNRVTVDLQAKVLEVSFNGVECVGRREIQAQINDRATVVTLVVKQPREVSFDGFVAVFSPVAPIGDGDLLEARLGNEDGEGPVSLGVFPIVHPLTIRTGLLRGYPRPVITPTPISDGFDEEVWFEVVR